MFHLLFIIITFISISITTTNSSTLHPFIVLFSRTTSWYQNGKTSVDLDEARYDGVLGWQWH